MLKEGERIDTLGGAVQVIQSNDVFAFSLDAVLLAAFAQVKPTSRVVDLAAGNGAVGLFLAPRTTGQVTLIELQPRLADMAQRSVALNGFSDHVDVLTMDLANAAQAVAKDSVDIVTCNPPYFKVNDASVKNPNPYLAIARHELTTNFETVAKTAASLLKYQGKAFFVHRPDRLEELLATLAAAGLAPKRLRFVYPKAGREANMVLIETIKAGRPGGLRILPPLVVYGSDGQYLEEVRRLLYG
ncbi:tRNA1(Val) (adenine(37)-N6)-methyltransferase [Lacticaseibacillus yichunensis]|uniref:tRNA1(Val) (Adenine(37)-N6)-methyltransferase n=1 Tax=Lacticaseibacillus yichunensis TaxID=2486015 RepID=A0ABW4CQI1_9LACO|nr:tRNA1(Val) (adenine(37)-N6)-methyltransferase [Lacticaseibacillus yichunensis]